MLGSLFGKSAAPLSVADRWAVALSSMYARLNGGRDDRLAPFGTLQRQKSWNMLRQNWGVDGVTRRKKHDQSRTTLDWLQGSGHRSELADPNDLEAFRDLFAWDVARLVHVARHAFHAGFLDEGEAWSYIRPMARETQRHYPSWAEYGRRFTRGRSRWLTERDETFDLAISGLLEDPGSPWRQLAWTTALGAAEPR